ncbi:MAG: FAD-binding oxidoreductase [Saprospiraceae bacterium]|nr:FAD-binding oxidoreductase [Saprospiraceae bacterium]
MGKQDIDYLIVGGGIAGALLAYALVESGKSVKLVHASINGEASPISAGLINPITGQRFVKTWQWELLHQVFVDFYTKLELDLQCNLLRSISIFQYLNSIEEENQCASRMLDIEYQNYLEFDKSKVNENDIFPLLKINRAYLLDINLLLKKIFIYLEQKGVLFIEKFDYSDFDPVHLVWKKFEIKGGVVFSEGAFVMDNPFFQNLPFMAVKGHRSIVESKDYLFDNNVFKLNYSIIPIDKHRYWIGSNYEFNNRSVELNKEECEAQRNFIENNVILPRSTIVNQTIGIRPAMRDRRPVVGSHPDYKRIYIINGLGTKGSSLAPYCVTQLVKYMLNGENVDKEIHIKRFIWK